MSAKTIVRPAARTKAAKKPARKATTRNKAEDWRELKAADIMQTNVITVTEDAPLSEVETLLSENRITGMPVTDEAGELLGVISVTDLIERYTEDSDARPRRGRGFYDVSTYGLEDEDLETFEVPKESEETAGSLMTAEVLTVKADTPLRLVAKEMVKHKVHRLLVNEGRKTVGIISTMDLLRAASK